MDNAFVLQGSKLCYTKDGWWFDLRAKFINDYALGSYLSDGGSILGAADTAWKESHWPKDAAGNVDRNAPNTELLKVWSVLVPQITDQIAVWKAEADRLCPTRPNYNWKLLPVSGTASNFGPSH